MTISASEGDSSGAAAETFLGHPRGLFVLTFMEAWERFAFFGMQMMLVLYMVDQLLQPGHIDHILGFAGFRHALESVYGPKSETGLASIIFGLFGGFAYLTPSLGGFIGDRWLGQRGSVLLAAVLLTAGHFLMAFEASFLIALSCLMVGSGLIKGNISTQVGGLYADGDRRRADGFLIFHMGDSAGGVVAPLICGTLGEVFGWRYGFGAAGVGMLIGSGVYLWGLRLLPVDRLKVRGSAPRPRLQPGDVRTIAALLIVMAVVTSFLIAVNQLGNAYPLWVKRYVDRTAFGMQAPITWLFSFSALSSVTLPPVLLRIWQHQARRGREATMLGKIGIGCALCALAFALLAALAAAGSAGHIVPLAWLLLFHFIFAVGFLFVWPVGLALFSRAAPASVAGTIMGVFFLSEFAANNAVGLLGGLYEVLTPAQFWLLHAAIPAAGALSIVLLGRILAPVLNERAAITPPLAAGAEPSTALARGA